jgi:hypothetical protein
MLIIALAATALMASLAVAEPGVTVEYREGVPTILLDGYYPGSSYMIYRSNLDAGPFESILDNDQLCIGTCYVEDFEAEPGMTYWYRFDLEMADGSFQSFGPFSVTISAELAPRVGAVVLPNPGAGAARVNLFLSGRPQLGPVQAEASIYDLQGRQQVVLHRGAMSRGTTRIEWNGRGRDGRPLSAGLYFLRVSSPLGTSVTRVVRMN